MNTSLQQLLESLSSDEQEKIQNEMIPRSFARNKIIFHEEQEADGMYLITSGMVKIVKGTPDGHNKILAILSAGEIFGEMALFDAAYRTASVIALQDTDTIFCSVSAFERLNREIPAMSRVIISFLSQRLRQTNQQVTDALYVKARPRLVKSLLELHRHCGTNEKGTAVIPLALTHEDIGGIVGISRETATKLLGELEAEEYIRKEKKAIYLLDLPALEAETLETN